MFISNVVDIGPEELLNCNVPLDDAPVWEPGEYQEGDVVVFSRSVFRATTATTDRPDEGAVLSIPTWVRRGYANRWRMWTEGADSVTRNPGSIYVEFAPDTPCTILALFNVTGFKVKVSVPANDFEVEYDLVDVDVDNWWDYLFAPYTTKSSVTLDIIHFSGDTIIIELEGAGELPEELVGIGRVACGLLEPVARTAYDSAVGRESFSTRRRNEFGYWEGVKRRNVKTISYIMNFDTDSLDFVESVFEKYVDVPALYIGHPSYPHLTVFGICESYTLTHSTFGSSDGTADVVEF